MNRIEASFTQLRADLRINPEPHMAVMTDDHCLMTSGVMMVDMALMKVVSAVI